MSTRADERELLASARKVASLANRQRRLKRELKRIAADLRLERRHLKAIAAAKFDPDIVPSQLFGGHVGYQRKGER